MSPLQQIAVGLLLVVLDSTTAYDTLPDPLGWALLLPAVALLPQRRRGGPLAVGALAAAVAVATYLPAARDAVAGADQSVEWATLLVPDLAFAWVLCRALAAVAGEAGDLRGAAWLRITGTVLLLLALAPVPFLATDRSVPGDLGFVLQLTWLLVVVLLFGYHGRPWAPQRRRRVAGGRDEISGSGPRRPASS